MSVTALGYPETLHISGMTFTRNERRCYPIKAVIFDSETYLVEVMVMIVNLRIVLTYCDPNRKPEDWTYEQGFCYPQDRAVLCFAAALEWQPDHGDPVGHIKRAI